VIPERALPHSWQWSSFRDIATVASNLVNPAAYRDLPHIAPNHIESQTGRLLPHSTVAEDKVTSAKHLFHQGQILYSKIRPYLAKVVEAPSSGLCSADMYPIETMLVPRFLLYWLLSPEFTQYASHVQGRTVLPKINRGQLEALPVPVPPLGEQERIVAAIEEQFSRVDAGLAALERTRQHLKRMRAAVLQAAVTGRLVPQDSTDGDAAPLIARATAARREYLHARGRKFSEPLQFPDEALPGIPSSWRWASLDLLAEVVGGITKDAKKQLSDHLIEVPYLRVANVQRGYLDLNKVATIRVSPEQRDALRLLPGDVLFNEGGDRDKLGRGWVWEGQIDPCIHQNHVFRARLQTDVLHPRLLSWHGNTFGQQWFTKGGKQTTNLASVSKTTLRSFPVPIPPRREQDRIVDAVERHLSLLDQLEATVTAAERRGGRLRTSIVAAAFSGQLVPQDPEDEPVSVLLERIASERAASNGRGFRTRAARRRKITA
jgi:type I restriction enzyme, S subunit